MKKKLILGIFCLLGLGSLVVFGNSPQLIGNLLESVKYVPIGNTLLSDTQSDHGKTKNVASNLEQISERMDDATEQNVPDTVLWGVIFGFHEKLAKAAEKARQEGQDDSLWTNYFIRQGGLSPQANETLKNVAIAYKNEIAPIEEKAKTIVQELREKSSMMEKTGIKSADIPSPPAEIVELQTQRDNITLNYKANLQTAIGAAEFAKFENWVRTDFAKGFEIQKNSSKATRNPSTAPTDNKFVPFTETQKREITIVEDNNQ